LTTGEKVRHGRKARFGRWTKAAHCTPPPCVHTHTHRAVGQLTASSRGGRVSPIPPTPQHLITGTKQSTVAYSNRRQYCDCRKPGHRTALRRAVGTVRRRHRVRKTDRRSGWRRVGGASDVPLFRRIEQLVDGVAVLAEVLDNGAAIRTRRAGERLDARVHELMANELRAHGEPLVALVARERLLVVTTLVAAQPLHRYIRQLEFFSTE